VLALGDPGCSDGLDAFRSHTATKGTNTVKQFIKGLRRAAVLTAVTATLVTVAAGASSAGTRVTATPQQAAAAAVHPDFTAQARGAGLTAAQAATLQAEVDGYLAETGGTQISANQVLLANGSGELTVPLPGQRYAADLVTPAGVTPALSDGHCDYRNFCAFSGTAYSRARMEWFACGTYYMPWTNPGSFDDFQTPGTVSTFYEINNTHFPVVADRLDPDILWQPIYNITIC